MKTAVSYTRKEKIWFRNYEEYNSYQVISEEFGAILYGYYLHIS